MKKILATYIIALCLSGCNCKEPPDPEPTTPTPYTLEYPDAFEQISLPASNPLTEEGIELGRHLFFDARLSSDESISCASCHHPEKAFSDTVALSLGVQGRIGTRNSMPLFNLMWYKKFMWDGAANSVYNQILIPLSSPIEMNVKPADFPNLLARLRSDEKLVSLFESAFPGEPIDMEKVFKGLEQYLATLISANSKYDKGVATGDLASYLSADEYAGYLIFTDIGDQPGSGECAHCHTLGTNFTDGEFRNNGLDALPQDSGRGRITLNELDLYKFKVPSVRNLSYTAPYMHDGRFQTLDEVLDFYNTQIDTNSPNLDPNLLGHAQLIGRLSNKQKAQLKKFLLTLDDPDFINNPKHKKP